MDRWGSALDATQLEPRKEQRSLARTAMGRRRASSNAPTLPSFSG